MLSPVRMPSPKDGGSAFSSRRGECQGERTGENLRGQGHPWPITILAGSDVSFGGGENLPSSTRPIGPFTLFNQATESTVRRASRVAQTCCRFPRTIGDRLQQPRTSSPPPVPSRSSPFLGNVHPVFAVHLANADNLMFRVVSVARIPTSMKSRYRRTASARFSPSTGVGRRFCPPLSHKIHLHVLTFLSLRATTRPSVADPPSVSRAVSYRAS